VSATVAPYPQVAYGEGKIVRIVTATAVALALVGATAPAATAHPSATDGIRRTDGYGTVLSIRNGTLQECRTTTVSCVAGDTALRTDGGVHTTPEGTALTVRVRGERTSGDRTRAGGGHLPHPAQVPFAGVAGVAVQPYGSAVVVRVFAQVRPGTVRPGPGRRSGGCPTEAHECTGAHLTDRSGDRGASRGLPVRAGAHGDLRLRIRAPRRLRAPYRCARTGGKDERTAHEPGDPRVPRPPIGRIRGGRSARCCFSSPRTASRRLSTVRRRRTTSTSST
jgi:hypothetical protein